MCKSCGIPPVGGDVGVCVCVSLGGTLRINLLPLTKLEA